MNLHVLFQNNDYIDFIEFQIYQEFERLAEWKIEVKFEEQFTKLSKPLLLTTTIKKKFNWLLNKINNEKVENNKNCK